MDLNYKYTNAHAFICPCAAGISAYVRTECTHPVTVHTLTALVPVPQLTRSSFSNHSLHVTSWSPTVLSLLTFRDITESSQEPPES